MPQLVSTQTKQILRNWFLLFNLNNQLNWLLTLILKHTLENVPIHWTLKAIATIQTITAIHTSYLYTALRRNRLTPLVRFLHSDVTLLNAAPPESALFAAFFAAESIYLLRRLLWNDYTRRNGIKLVPIRLIKQVLFKKQIAQKDRRSIGRIRTRQRQYQLVIQYFQLVEVFILAVFAIQFLRFYYHFSEHLHSTGLLFIPLAFVNHLKLALLVHTYGVVNQLLSQIISAFTFSIFLRFEQLNGLIRRLATRSAQLPFPPEVYYHFTRRHTQTVLITFAGNHLFGGLLFGCFLFTLPFNLYIVTGIYLNAFTPTTTLMYLQISLFIYVIILGFHFVASLYCQKIHHCGAHLLAIAAKGRPLPLRDQLHLANYVAKFVVVQKYGITYGTLGLVSKFTVAKFMLLYIEILINCYKLGRGI